MEKKKNLQISVSPAKKKSIISQKLRIAQKSHSCKKWAPDQFQTSQDDVQILGDSPPALRPLLDDVSRSDNNFSLTSPDRA